MQARVMKEGYRSAMVWVFHAMGLIRVKLDSYESPRDCKEFLKEAFEVKAGGWGLQVASYLVGNRLPLGALVDQLWLAHTHGDEASPIAKTAVKNLVLDLGCRRSFGPRDGESTTLAYTINDGPQSSQIFANANLPERAYG